MSRTAHDGDEDDAAADAGGVEHAGRRHMGNVARLVSLDLCCRTLSVEISKVHSAVVSMVDLTAVGCMDWSVGAFRRAPPICVRRTVGTVHGVAAVRSGWKEVG